MPDSPVQPPVVSPSNESERMSPPSDHAGKSSSTPLDGSRSNNNDAAASQQVTPPPLPPLLDLLSLDPTSAKEDEIKAIVQRQIKADVEASPLLEKYNLVVVHDERLIARFHANRIYTALSSVDKTKPILLVLNSPGGEISSAYFIAKLCREHTTESFEVAVPRRAKSAATLICCGADRIHMGSLSELGPIDPQFGTTPALALKNSIEHIAQLATLYPASSSMFSEYLAKSLPIDALGYFERVTESAVQYAIRLLHARRAQPSDRPADEIAKHLAYSYKDHGFVIDVLEAVGIFGSSRVQPNSDEYLLSNKIFQSLDLIGYLFGRFDFDMAYVGGEKDGCWPIKRTSYDAAMPQTGSRP